MSFFLAALPILVFVIFLVGFSWRLIYVAPLGFLAAAVVAISVWALPLTYLVAALTKGLLLTFEIMLIIFGAVFFIRYLRDIGLLNQLELKISSLSPDRRIQAIMLAWLFGSFIEGTSGFGTPAVIVAPLLVGIGFPVLTSILICLVANSTSVAFGAVGTPIRIGFSNLEITGVANHAATINFFAGFIVPVSILYYVVRLGKENRWLHFIHALPWALFAGASFLVPYYLFSYLGYEFPSLLGATAGIFVVIIGLKKGVLLPQDALSFSTTHSSTSEKSNLLTALAPYVLLLFVLILGKFVFGRFHWSWLMEGDLSHSFQAFNPGFAFLTVLFLTALNQKTSFEKLVNIAKSVIKPLGLTAASIFFVSATTYTMILTGTEGRIGMLDILASPLSSSWLPFLSPFIGALGSFMAGSATVSNLLFGTIQMEAAIATNYETSLILALQLVGAGAGNMIALPNLLAVQAAVGITGQEPMLLKKLILPCLTYLLMAVMVGYFLL